jgi:hypothetical protein
MGQTAMPLIHVHGSELAQGASDAARMFRQKLPVARALLIYSQDRADGLA